MKDPQSYKNARLASHKVASRALALNRKIYASLPFEYRVARLLATLKIGAVTGGGVYGRVFYAEFIKAGVTDMPDVKGEPALSLRDTLLKMGRNAYKKLPENYGRKFGEEVWRVAAKYMGSEFGMEENVEEVVQNVMLALFKSDNKIKALPLPSAESYVKWQVQGRAKDLYRKLKRDSERTFSMSEKGPDKSKLVLLDENAIKQFVQLLGPRGERELVQRLRTVDHRNPDRALSWVEAQLEGLSGKELAEEWGVAPSAVSTWVTNHKPDIRKVFMELFNEGDL